MKFSYFPRKSTENESGEYEMSIPDIALEDRLRFYKSSKATGVPFFKDPLNDSIRPQMMDQCDTFRSPWTEPSLMPYCDCRNNFGNLRNTKAYQVFLNGNQANRTQKNERKLQPTPNCLTSFNPATFNSCFEPFYNCNTNGEHPPFRWVDPPPENKRSVQSQTDICDVRSTLKNEVHEKNHRNVIAHHEVASQTDNPEEICSNYIAFVSKDQISMGQGLFSRTKFSRDPKPKSVPTSRAVTNNVRFDQHIKSLSNCSQEKPTSKPVTAMAETEIYRTRYVNCLDSTCEWTFTSQKDLSDHLLEVHNISPCHCPLMLECGLSFEKNEQLEAHMKEVHGDLQVWDCYSCMRLFDNRLHFEIHLETEHYHGRFECTKCNFASLTRKVVITHYWQVHKGEAFIIDI
ncbi:hypothetical protein TYRP_004878 [Tyrophagus putrescentiae]|nr:hypothetical protein TYRP_004878 [Tyrophagus putrescentiae]